MQPVGDFKVTPETLTYFNQYTDLYSNLIALVQGVPHRL